MSKKINEDIKKWHREIGELIISKNVKNYDYTFIVPNKDILHTVGYGNTNVEFASSCLLFERNLLSYLLDKHGVPRNAKDRFLLFCEIDYWFDQIKDQIHKGINSLKKKSKVVTPISSSKKGGKK